MPLPTDRAELFKKPVNVPQCDNLGADTEWFPPNPQVVSANLQCFALNNAEHTGQTRMIRLLVAANVPSLPIIVTLIMEVIRPSEMSVLTRATRRHIPEDSILHSHRRQNLKSYIALTGWAL
jgi:hypothetical protein